MKIGIAVLCRMNSSRLAGKALIDIGGRPLLGHILARLSAAVPELPIVVATSDTAADDAIAKWCARANIPCHRGDLYDVAGRFLDCAEVRGWDFAVRINGDNLFVDATTLREMLAITRTDYFDMVTNVPGRSFPVGMSVEILRTGFLRSAMATASHGHHREHVTSWLYENPDLGRRYVHINHRFPKAAALHLAIDTAEDLALARRIIHRAGPHADRIGLSEVLALLRETGPSPWRGRHGPLLIAEIGGNHEGDFEVAKQMTAQAIRSGADCVKFQIYTGDSLVNPVESPARHKHFQSFELTPDQHIELARMCREADVIYNASVWDLAALDWIDPWLDFYKIGSGDLTAWPIVRELARRGKPIMLSTGLSTLDEVVQTVHQIQKVDDRYREPEWLCVLQCTSMYPINDADANLLTMQTLRQATGVEVGYSDHTVGSAALVAAVAMGAAALEFHFTDSRENKTFRDHKVSLTEEEVRSLCCEVSRVSSMRGDGIKVPQTIELAEGHEVSFRRAAYLRRAVPTGHCIGEEDLVLLRPAYGTDARDVDSLVGALALAPLKPLKALQPGRDYRPAAGWKAAQ